MKLLKLLSALFIAIASWIKRQKRRHFLSKQNKKLQEVVNNLIIRRKQLRRDTDAFLYEFFGIDARSKYIPHDFKNAAEVKAAIIDKFGKRMDLLNVTYSDLYK
jgi:hypothetical protein